MLKISVVTPSYNQAQFLEDTIKSVLHRGYANLEYIIIDGGSTDGSVDIIKRYADKLKYWVSEPDNGRGNAVNKGFKHATGDIMAWLGCGDQYFPWTLRVVNEIFTALAQIEWLTTSAFFFWYKSRIPSFGGYKSGFGKELFFNGAYLPGRWSMQQESTFWRRSLWETAGGYVNKDFKIVQDFELWARFWQKAQLYTTSVPLGGIMMHKRQKGYFPEAYNVAKSVLKGCHHNSDIKMFYHNVCYALSRIPILRRLIRSTAFTVNYNCGNDRWIIEKIRARI
ncbi:MAG: glycosyltransferase [Candidatus Omnitrophica bacterium CG12_big_fil_rev_8_21_14_0_65_43_15]|uniref:Glycosyltransferase n=1 Tax=Candidatus Taenaricola geysiri TaxID=1974752 RepID=A0A2J0LKE3_9BACT|nr:MAG: glycosyltransferase [Candidatus Omnitrophica bacterium CG12_big_fil_rev_8_21_14_0_65_43_15]